MLGYLLLAELASCLLVMTTTVPLVGGVFILVAGIICASMAYIMHIWRISQVKASKEFDFSHTMYWSSMIAALTIVTLSLELYFGILHPYLDREKAVTIANQEG
mmetsp:Transcript_31819/g.32071  ORF Transcript_31819/g.32071 Transcript_31819/m.32071 type:complete len:104 (-) Transcript_31819:71-382(-)